MSRRAVRVVWFMAGSICLFLGLVGIVVPLLPTTPFLLAAVACYLKSSVRAHRWLLTNRLFGGYLKNYKEGRGFSVLSKITILMILWATISVSIFLVNILLAQLALIVVAVAVSAHVMLLPTLKRE